MPYLVIGVPVVARFGGIGGEGDCGCDRDKPERANPPTTRGNQVGPKHELSRPIFCLDHRFVRPNYARRPGEVSLFRNRQRGFNSAPVGRQSAILAKTLFTNRFLSLPPSEQTQGIRVGGRGFQMIKEGLRESTGFEVFSVTAGSPCATHNFTRPGWPTARADNRDSLYPQPHISPVACRSTPRCPKGRAAKFSRSNEG